jgi:hypothetical protein
MGVLVLEYEQDRLSKRELGHESSDYKIRIIE